MQLPVSRLQDLQKEVLGMLPITVNVKKEAVTREEQISNTTRSLTAKDSFEVIKADENFQMQNLSTTDSQVSLLCR